MEFNISQLEGAEKLVKLNAAFVASGHEIRVVGGAVRDLMLGQTPKDIDLATTATPNEMREIAQYNGFSIFATGEAHGTMTISVDHFPVEVTTLRIDTDTDGRHANVEFTRSFEEDAARRDLSINAMSMDFEGNVFDYFGGREDLEANRVRFVGDTEQRIREDYLRILRFFRFAARMDAVMDNATLMIINDLKTGLDQISRERVWLEMSKLFKTSGRVRVFQEMKAWNVDTQIGLPRINSGGLLQFANSAEAAVALFFKGDGDAARAFCNAWKMSGDETAKIVWIAANYYNAADHKARENVENWLNEGKARDWVVDLAALHWSDRGYTADLDWYAAHFQTTVFPVKGQDLLDAGMKPGKEVGQRLTAMREAWVASRFTLTREELMAS